MNKSYNILLEGQKIGTTLLEKADAPMGVVFGTINFVNIKSPYKFLKEYCINRQIIFDDDIEFDLILTQAIPELKVLRQDGIEIKGIGNAIEGLEGEFEVSILGIAYPFYEEEFPHHVRAYREMF